MASLPDQIGRDMAAQLLVHLRRDAEPRLARAFTMHPAED